MKQQGLKITVLTIPEQPTFFMPLNSTELEIKKEIKKRYGIIGKQKTKRILHEWVSQRIEVEEKLDQVLVLQAEVQQLQTELRRERQKNITLWNGLKKLKKLAILNTAQNCLIERQGIKMGEPLVQDLREAIKRIDGEIARLNLKEIEEEMEGKKDVET